MALTKTKFINYIRCPRYCVLDDIKRNDLEADVSLEEYKEEEQISILQDVYNSMFDNEGNSLIDIVNEQLEVMLPYYNKIELLASNHVKNIFGGNPISSLDNKKQESFDFNEDGIKYLCYVDIYNERNNYFDIIEVKATTSRKFLNLGPSTKNEFGESVYNSIFVKKEDNIYYLKDEIDGYKIEDEMPLDKYYFYKAKLSDKYHACGHYIYDILVQRMIIEGYLKENKQAEKIDKIKYYLAVLNSEYIFNGEYDSNEEPIYNQDENGNDIIVLFDVTNITKELLDKVELDRKRIVSYLREMNPKSCDLGPHCEYKKNTKCSFLDVCFYKKVPKKNSVLNYMDNHFGFKDKQGNKHSSFDLINNGIINMLDVPEEWLTRSNNIIQRRVVLENNPYVNYQKIKDGLSMLEYPLYHLDFETFPCPLPRYKGEKCYTQSVFQFSLHIEHKPGVCDKEKDHYTYLAPNHNDCRKELINQLINYINTSKGTVIAYNQDFEKGRLKELADIFPEYKVKLMDIRDMVYDLLFIVKNNSKLYKELNYDDKEAKEVNFYHTDLNGSFSIKKVLPIFAKNLDYKNLEVQNGSEALTTYALFPKLSKKEYNQKYKALLEYCKQDTWAMVIILDELRKIIK